MLRPSADVAVGKVGGRFGRKCVEGWVGEGAGWWCCGCAKDLRVGVRRDCVGV